MYGSLGFVNDLCVVICVLWQEIVYYDLCILDRFMSAMYIVQSGLCIVFAHNGAIAAHYFPDNKFSVCTQWCSACETSNLSSVFSR